MPFQPAADADGEGRLSAFGPLESGQDDSGGSGIAFYDIYISDNNGPFILWLGRSLAMVPSLQLRQIPLKK
jgi:hypothetical protein